MCRARLLGQVRRLRNPSPVVVEPRGPDRPGPAGAAVRRHLWLHEGGYTITGEHEVLVFRDPRGRFIANVNHILAQQLDLLRRTHPPNETTETTAAGNIVRDL